jgi:uncharacterized protein YbjT (DUF2867 family)
MERMVLVIGASGGVGGEVMRQLTATGSRVRALVRSAKNAQLVRGFAAGVVLGDLRDIPSLRTALTDVDHVFLATPHGPRAEYFTGALVEAAASLSPHIVRLSVLGADANSSVELAKHHGRADRLLQQSGLPCTILRPHFLMQNFQGPFAETIAGDSMFGAPMKDGAIGLVDMRDVAAVAAECLRGPGYAGRTYDITGPDAMTFDDLAGHISEAAGRHIGYLPQTSDEAFDQLTKAGMKKELVEWLIQCYGLFASGQASKVTNTVREVTGVSPRTFSLFAHEYAALWG